MTEPIWMEMADAVIFHDMQLATHGGSSGIRDAAMLESALMRPRNLWAYAETASYFAWLAAAYAFGISSNHPFIDGNKRTALVVSFAFLEINGITVTATQEDAYMTFLALAAGQRIQEQLSEWFDLNTAPLDR
jgi:death on curing protein